MVALAELPQEAVEEDEAGEVHEVCGHRAKERRPNAREEPSRAAAGDGERGESAGTRGVAYLLAYGLMVNSAARGFG